MMGRVLCFEGFIDKKDPGILLFGVSPSLTYVRETSGSIRANRIL